MWYDLSDVKLAEALDGKSRVRSDAIRGFLGGRSHAGAHHLRSWSQESFLIAQDLDKALFEQRSPPNSRPRRSGSRQGRLSTPPSLPPRAKATSEARWVKLTKAGRRSMASKAHVGADADTAHWSRKSQLRSANVAEVMMAKPDLGALPDEAQARYSPTASVSGQEELFARPSRPRAAVCASLRPACGVVRRGGNVGAS